MNDDFNDDGVERRPNFYSMPHGNWARLKLKGWKIHHTSEKNWARGIHLEHDGWQISDSIRGLIVKALGPTAGAWKTVTNTLFVGMSKNTGHKLCGWDQNGAIEQPENPDSWDLITPRSCGISKTSEIENGSKIN